jgi:hypothetical protein
MGPEVKRLDRLFSEYIRKRALREDGGCQRCGQGKGSYKQLQTSHFISRRYRSLRWDPDNACGLCGACHMYLTGHPQEHVKFFQKRLGPGYDLLLWRRDWAASGLDLAAIELYLKQELKGMDAVDFTVDRERAPPTETRLEKMKGGEG